MPGDGTATLCKMNKAKAAEEKGGLLRPLLTSSVSSSARPTELIKPFPLMEQGP